MSSVIQFVSGHLEHSVDSCCVDTVRIGKEVLLYTAKIYPI